MIVRLAKNRKARAWALSGLALALAWYFCLPKPLFREPVSAVLLSAGGELLGARIAEDGQWRFPPPKTLPEKYKQALIHFEDKRFRLHPGVDPAALARSVYTNYKRGKVVSGGSTITMQVIRLSRKNPPRTYPEKLLEILLALRLECGCSKDEILALYAGHAPFGGNVVGLEGAAWRYYGRSPELLSWGESALLAVLPNSPSLIRPGRNSVALKVKRDALLRRLSLAGVLDGSTMELAQKEPLPGEPYPLPRAAPQLLDTLAAERRALSASLRVGPFSRLKTTLDGALQKSVQSIVRRYSDGMLLHGIRNAAVIVIDNGTFEVKAYVGNSRDDDGTGKARAGSGYAIDLVRKPRSTGSVLKPLLFAAMLQSGELLSTTLVPDLPTQFGNFMPQNFDRKYRGAVPARTALAQSLNVPAVRMLKKYGVPRFYDFLKNLGMSTLHRDPQGYGLSLIVGGAEGTLWDLTRIYANMAHLAKGGEKKGAARLHELRILADSPDAGKTTNDLGPGAAWLTMKALLDVTRPGEEGYWENFDSSRRIAWKTGTSYGHRDAWAIGSDARHTVGVWLGNADGESRLELVGVAAAAPLLFEVFSRLPYGGWFDIPEAYLKEVEVCKNDGYLPFGGCETAKQWSPLGSNFDQISPHNKTVHLDASGKWRVHGKCEAVSKMKHTGWFSLPPGQEYFYRRYYAGYKPLPPYRRDCEADADKKKGPVEFLYPNADSRIYIPIDLAEKKGRVVFEAAHTWPDAALFWHLDGNYIGRTAVFHQQALDIEPGPHEITIVDHEGNYATRRFEILGVN
ncbi:MAG: penicillin-binding protein 1C [Elusimicrobia bacterium]|nr:penicillin-binding protein 1C [Elusimicrobiota bacterium]